MNKIILIILSALTIFALFSCDLMMDGTETGENNPGTVNNGGTNNNTGTNSGTNSGTNNNTGTNSGTNSGTNNNGTNGGTENNNNGNGTNGGAASGTRSGSSSIYGNYRLGEDTYEYRNDGYVYKNGTKSNKFSVLDNGKLRLFNSTTDSDGYKDYDYTAGEDGLVYGDWNYSRVEAGTAK